MQTVPYEDGAQCIVYYHPSLQADGAYYYTMFMQNFGWSRNANGGWSGNGFAIRPKEGTMYVNPAQKVAIYFYPSNDAYDIFRVKIIRS